MVQFSNRTKFFTSEKKWYNTQTVPKPVNRHKKDGIILKQSQNLSPVRKRCKILRAKICQQSKQDGAILKQNKPLTSQKKMVQYSNKANNCHQSENDGTILKHGQNLSTGRKKMV